MPSCYKAIIEGREHYVSGWTPKGKLQLADGSEIAMTPLDPQLRPGGRIQVIARLKRGILGWQFDGKNLSDVISRARARANGNKTQRFRALRQLSAMLEIPLISGSPSLWSSDKTRARQAVLRLEGLRKVVGVAFCDKHMSSGPTRVHIPILLTSFDVVANTNTNTKMQRTQERLDKTEQAASLTLEDAFKAFMRFDLPGTKAGTRARIKEAVFIYTTQLENRSLAKIARQFKVSRQCVSQWFKKFTAETGFPVVTHQRHESIASQSHAARNTVEYQRGGKPAAQFATEDSGMDSDGQEQDDDGNGVQFDRA